VIVALEKLLNAGPFELRNRLLHRICVCILPFRVCVLGIEVIFTLRRDERRRLLFLIKFFPVVIFKPLVVFEVLRTVKPESV